MEPVAIASCGALTKLLLNWSGEIVAALVGAFVGAGAAFWLQMRREKQLKADKEYAAIIKAQHAMLFMWWILAVIRYTYLDARRQDAKDRHRILGKYWMIDLHVSIDLDSLAFLFRPKMREVVSLCFFAERAFLSAVDAVKERNGYWSDITTKRAAESFDPETKMARLPLDPVKDQMLKDATDALYNAVDNGMAHLQGAFAELRRDALIVFPDRAFLKDENLTEEAIKRKMAAPENAK